MSYLNFQGPPGRRPPQPLVHENHRKRLRSRSRSRSPDPDPSIRPIQTHLVPTEDANIEGHFDEARGEPIIFLSGSIITDIGLDLTEESKSAFYDSRKIRCMAVDRRHRLGQGTENKKAGIRIQPEMAENLRMVMENATASLEKGIAYYRMMLDRTPPWDYRQTEKWSLCILDMRACLLHGENCKVWKKSKVIASGKLSFCGLRNFSVRDRAGNFRIFYFSNEHFMSGKYRIEKHCDEMVTDVEEETYEVITGL